MHYNYACDPAPEWMEAPSASGIVIESHGARIFGRFLAPAVYEKDQRFPVVILCHGFPGLEQNIDLAYALSRAGFITIYFWYRGVWGSHGEYSFSHIIEDVGAVVDHVKSGKTALPIDPDRIYLFGHSMGGFAVLNALAAGVEVSKAVLMAPCDLGRRYLMEKDRLESLLSSKENGYFTLSHPTALEEDVETHAEQWHFPALANKLPKKTAYTFIAGLQDTVTPPETNIAPLMEKMQQAGLRVRYHAIDDGHSFNGNRLQLAQLTCSIFKE